MILVLFLGIVLKRWLMRGFETLAIQQLVCDSERKYYFFYKRSNIKVKLNQNKSAVMQSYRYKCSQIRCRETEVLPLPLPCRIYQITNSNHQSIIVFSLVINHSRDIVVYIYIVMIYNIIEYMVYQYMSLLHDCIIYNQKEKLL